MKKIIAGLMCIFLLTGVFSFGAFGSESIGGAENAESKEYITREECMIELLQKAGMRIPKYADEGVLYFDDLKISEDLDNWKYINYAGKYDLFVNPVLSKSRIFEPDKPIMVYECAVNIMRFVEDMSGCSETAIHTAAIKNGLIKKEDIFYMDSNIPLTREVFDLLLSRMNSFPRYVYFENEKIRYDYSGSMTYAEYENTLEHSLRNIGVFDNVLKHYEKDASVTRLDCLKGIMAVCGLENIWYEKELTGVITEPVSSEESDIADGGAGREIFENAWNANILGDEIKLGEYKKFYPFEACTVDTCISMMMRCLDDYDQSGVTLEEIYNDAKKINLVRESDSFYNNGNEALTFETYCILIDRMLAQKVHTYFELDPSYYLLVNELTNEDKNITYRELLSSR